VAILQSLARRIPNRLKPPLRYLYSEYSFRRYSRPVRAGMHFYISHSGEIEAQMSTSFAAELLQALFDTNHLGGDIIECGTYKGGSTILMAHVLDMIGSTKRIYGCDTFKGHPYDDIASAVDHHRAGRGSDTSVSYVRSKFRKFRVYERVTIVEGKFEDALVSQLGDRTFSLAFLDCDLYDSAKFCYSFLYPRMVPGACMVVHDYVEPDEERVFGISPATDEFLREKGLVIEPAGSPHLIRIP
jgi:predicted O-methyltransferase YrrM